MKSLTLSNVLFRLYLISCCFLTLNVKVGSAVNIIGSNTAIAKVIKVTPGIGNEWIAAVEDPKSPSGYSVKFKKDIEKVFFENNFLVFMFSKNSSNARLKDVFASRVCDLLNPENKHYSNYKFLPRQVMDIILPGHFGKCYAKASTNPINASGNVSTDAKSNLDAIIPKSTPFELIVNILSQQQIDDPENKYFFQVRFSVGGSFKDSANKSSKQ